MIVGSDWFKSSIHRKKSLESNWTDHCRVDALSIKQTTREADEHVQICQRNQACKQFSGKIRKHQPIGKLVFSSDEFLTGLCVLIFFISSVFGKSFIFINDDWHFFHLLYHVRKCSNSKIKFSSLLFYSFVCRGNIWLKYNFSQVTDCIVNGNCKFGNLCFPKGTKRSEEICWHIS